jgi:membrane dipeptidase
MCPAEVFRPELVLFAAVLPLSCSGANDDPLEARVARIHEQAIVIDAHAHPKPGYAEGLNLGERTPGFELDFLTMEEGGLDAVFFSAPLLVAQAEGPPGRAEILEDLGSVVHEVEKLVDLAEIARAPGDMERIHALGKRAVFLGLEAQDPLGGDLGALQQYFDAGVRMITLPPEPLQVSDGQRADSEEGSLNAFGRRVVEEMNRLGIIVDVTHIPDRLQMDVIRASRMPVVASHSCTRALNDVPRQIPDSIIRALADKGGVIAVTFFPGHISSDFEDQAVTIQDLVDHIDHIVRVAGIDHVGFGSDFLGSDTPHPVGLESAAGLPNLTLELVERGYSQKEIEKILGGNLLRVFEAVAGAGG